MTFYAQVDQNDAVISIRTDPTEDEITEFSLIEVQWTKTPRPGEGYRLKVVSGEVVWVDDRDLQTYKQDRIVEIRAEALTKVQAIYEGIESYATLELFIGLWVQGLSAAAKQPQGDWALMLQTLTAARTAITSVKAATTRTEVDAVVVNWP